VRNEKRTRRLRPRHPRPGNFAPPCRDERRGRSRRRRTVLQGLERRVPDLVRQATAPEFVSCRSNDICNTRDEVVAGIGARLASIPDLKWQIKEVLVSGNQVIVRGEATGTPAGEFMGAPHTGKSFKLMSIDVHTLEGGKMIRSYHIEDWIGAVRQLTAK
jgi:predicted ester cyclase